MRAAKQKVILTDRHIKALPIADPGKRYIVWDAVQPHLGVRTTETGSKTFMVVRRAAGQKNAETHVLGKYPALSLKDARTAAATVVRILFEGE